MTKIDSLTGLRFFAALAVFGSHLAQPAGVPGPASTFLMAGYNGVTLFFVLSGFVLTYTYADRLATPTRAEVWDFAVARVARIAPLYFAALLFVVLYLQANLPTGSWMHVLALQTWSPNLDVAWALNPPAWSIGVETFLYAMFPLVLWLMVRLSTRQLLGALAGAVLVLAGITAAVYAAGSQELPWGDAWSAHRLLYRTPLTRLPDFMLGVAVALLVMRGRAARRWAPAAQWVAVVTVVAMMCNDRMLYAVVSWDLAYAIPFAALIWALAAAEDAPLARFLARPVVVKAGLASYAFYLFHWPLIQVVGIDTASGAGWALTSAAALGLVLLVAVGAHLAIEVPAQRWLRSRLSTRKNPRPDSRGVEPGIPGGTPLRR